MDHWHWGDVVKGRFFKMTNWRASTADIESYFHDTEIVLDTVNLKIRQHGASLQLFFRCEELGCREGIYT